MVHHTIISKQDALKEEDNKYDAHPAKERKWYKQNPEGKDNVTGNPDNLHRVTERGIRKYKPTTKVDGGTEAVF